MIVGGVDFKGQALAEKLYRVLMISLAAIGFVVGYVSDRFLYSFIIFAVGVQLALILVVPAWPIYKRHSVTWREELPEEDEQLSESTTEGSTSLSSEAIKKSKFL
ncbi:hypothetical protein ABK040_005135 [Willaertia magna]